MAINARSTWLRSQAAPLTPFRCTPDTFARLASALRRLRFWRVADGDLAGRWSIYWFHNLGF
jgi:hypothetical protein